jgi:glutamate N-acetyltransferase/amino-acid N-acetyltransferase
MFGRDANWGRVLCALGYSGRQFTPETTSVSFRSSPDVKRFFDPATFSEFGAGNTIKVFERGVPLDFNEDRAKKILSSEVVEILVEMEDGTASGRAWGCDLTYDYVKINGDYRT